jgi:hypothetical protein
MTRRVAFITPLLLLVALVTPITAMAYTQNGQQMMRGWAVSDKCAAAAQKAFPDFTPESNAKRDAQMKNCLAGSNLPPRGDLDRPAPKP